MVTKKKRLLNKLINLKEAKAQKEILCSWPVNVNLPINSKCNLDCIFCKPSRDKATSNVKELSFESLLRYISPIKYASNVSVYSWGEPLLHASYYKFLQFLDNHYPGLTIHISTNSILLTQKWIKRLMLLNNSIEINISLNAATRKTYLLLSKKDKFNKVTKNMRLLANERKKNKSDLSVSLSYVMMKQNINEFPMFITLAYEFGVDTVVPLPLIVSEKKLKKFSLDDMQGKTKDIILEAKQIAKERNVNISSGVLKAIDCSGGRWLNRCVEPWRSFKVNLNGDVMICCFSSSVAGNIFKQSVENIWNGEVYRTYRKRVNSNSPPLGCRICPVKNPLRFSVDIKR